MKYISFACLLATLFVSGCATNQVSPEYQQNLNITKVDVFYTEKKKEKFEKADQRFIKQGTTKNASKKAKYQPLKKTITEVVSEILEQHDQDHGHPARLEIEVLTATFIPGPISVVVGLNDHLKVKASAFSEKDGSLITEFVANAIGQNSGLIGVIQQAQEDVGNRAFVAQGLSYSLINGLNLVKPIQVTYPETEFQN